MALILHIETSSINCSVALSEGDQLLACIEKQEINIHASAITLFIDQVMKDSGKLLSDLNAIAVGKGPGSYTGLRIGVSTAKGLCYALNIPLISCQSLRTIYEQAKFMNGNKDVIYRPLIDARRMEVYTTTFNVSGEMLEEVSALIIDEHTFAQETAEKDMLYFGDGSEKIKQYYTPSEKLAYINGLYPSANFMYKEALLKFEKKEFEEVAYFEPFYLKEFYFNK